MAFSIRELTPKQQIISRFRSNAWTFISIANTSSTWAKCRIAVPQPPAGCYFEFNIPGTSTILTGQTEVWLPPDETVTLPIRVTLKPSPFLGWSKSVYQFVITATLLADHQPSRSVLGQVARPPLIGPWLASFAIFWLLLLGGVVIQTLTEWPVTSPQVGVLDGGEPIENRQKLTIIIPPTPVAGARPLAHTEQSYEQIFQEVGAMYALDWRLLAEIAYQESRMNSLAVGRDNDLGLMQIIPTTWNEWAPKVGVTDPFDPYSNVLVAAAYLAYNRDYARRHGHTEEEWMLIGYNWGPDNLRRHFADNYDWGELPEKRRNYALQILQARANDLRRWQIATP
jgi:hypothetical protein